MEDALVLSKAQLITLCKEGLNPCFNGRCTRTTYIPLSNDSSLVLILVLMEDALVHKERKRKRKGHKVLILVLMEDALVHAPTQSEKHLL